MPPCISPCSRFPPSIFTLLLHLLLFILLLLFTLFFSSFFTAFFSFLFHPLLLLLFPSVGPTPLLLHFLILLLLLPPLSPSSSISFLLSPSSPFLLPLSFLLSPSSSFLPLLLFFLSPSCSLLPSQDTDTLRHIEVILQNVHQSKMRKELVERSWTPAMSLSFPSSPSFPFSRPHTASPRNNVYSARHKLPKAVCQTFIGDLSSRRVQYKHGGRHFVGHLGTKVSTHGQGEYQYAQSQKE